MSNKIKIGLALSGGGARGIAHLGLLKALEELGVSLSVLSGTSAGAMISAFYAAGFSIEEIFSIVVENNFFKWHDFAFSKKGLLTVESNEKLFRSYLGNRTFSTLKIPIFLSAADVQTGELVKLSEGDLVSAILASSAIPMLFEPVLREGKLLIDGSAGDCFPVEAIRQSCDVLIGSYTNSIAATSRKLGMAEIFDRGYHMSLYSEVAIKKNHCELFLEPPRLSDYSMFDFKKAEEIYQIGYDYALSYSEVLKSF